VLNGLSESIFNQSENMDEMEKKKVQKELYKMKYTNKLLADHSFSYMHPDTSRIPEWEVCSVHGNKDRWISSFDHTNLQVRLPVRVSRGINTTSSFEAMIILKRRP